MSERWKFLEILASILSLSSSSSVSTVGHRAVWVSLRGANAFLNVLPQLPGEGTFLTIFGLLFFGIFCATHYSFLISISCFLLTILHVKFTMGLISPDRICATKAL